MLSPPLPLVHTVRATFMAYGAPSNLQALLSFAGTYGFIYTFTLLLDYSESFIFSILTEFIYGPHGCFVQFYPCEH